MKAIVLCASLLLALQNTPPPPPAEAPAPSQPAEPAASTRPAPSGTTAPKLIHQVPPEFSEEARRKKIGGVVHLSFTVGVDGVPTDVQVIGSLANNVPKKNAKAALSLDQKAIEAVKQYRFSPAMRNGVPVPVKLHVDVNFQIF